MLRAITAVKLGRSDLLIKLSAFSEIREHMNKEYWIKLARLARYETLLFQGFDGRQNDGGDNRLKMEAEMDKKQKWLKI